MVCASQTLRGIQLNVSLEMRKGSAVHYSGLTLGGAARETKIRKK